LVDLIKIFKNVGMILFFIWYFHKWNWEVPVHHKQLISSVWKLTIHPVHWATLLMCMSIVCTTYYTYNAHMADLVPVIHSLPYFSLLAKCIKDPRVYYIRLVVENIFSILNNILTQYSADQCIVLI
jgi:hypothetical protein